jgi:hypothetical protein
VVPEVNAPDGSGRVSFVVASWLCFGHVPEVEGVGDEWGELEEDEPLELASGDCSGPGGGLVVPLVKEEPGLLQEWVERLELVPVAVVLELKSNCTEILVLYQVLQ